uniref:Major facilitator superfamily (MFS) profile domain-containing protein n=1 Tax=Ditylenchus dipsaci TaxID=166011 RepID=A0A915EMN3_9BILA
MEECGENKTSVIRQIFTTPHIRFGLLLGILALQITTSIWPIIFFSTEFLRRANVSNELAEDLSSFMLLLSTVATFPLCSFHNFEEWRMCSNICVCWPFCCHGISYSFATGPIAWFITAELVPTQYRSTCQSIALSVNHMMAFALTLFVLPLYDLVDSFALLILLVIPTAIALFVLYLWLPETRARDIQQVISDLQTGNICGGSRVESYEMSTKVFEKNIIS